VVQPAANEVEVQQRTPLIRGRFFFGGEEAEAGSGSVGVFHPSVFHPSLRNGVGIQAQES
jgi:hypothetical protein